MMYTVCRSRCRPIQLQHMHKCRIRFSQVTALVWSDLESCSRRNSSFFQQCVPRLSQSVVHSVRVLSGHVAPTLLPLPVGCCGAVRSLSFFSSSETVFALSSGHGKCGKFKGVPNVHNLIHKIKHYI